MILIFNRAFLILFAFIISPNIAYTDGSNQFQGERNTLIKQSNALMEKNAEDYTKLGAEFKDLILKKSKKINKITVHVLGVSGGKLDELSKKLSTAIKNIAENPTRKQTLEFRAHCTSYRNQTAQIMKILRDKLKMLKGEKKGAYEFYGNYQSTRKAFFKNDFKSIDQIKG